MAMHDNNGAGAGVGSPYSISLSLDSNEKSRTSIPPQNVEPFFGFLEGNFLFETLRKNPAQSKRIEKKEIAPERDDCIVGK